jgi:hypothetical protein
VRTLKSLATEPSDTERSAKTFAGFEPDVLLGFTGSALTPSRRCPDMLRSEGAGELLILQEHVIRQSIQKIDEVDLVLL